MRLNCKLGFLPHCGNFIGGYIAKCVPQKRKNILSTIAENKGSVCNFLSVFDIDADFILKNDLLESFRQNTLIAFSSFKSAVDEYADVIFLSLHVLKAKAPVNLEGRLQTSPQVIEPPGNSKELWRVLRVLSSTLGLKELDVDSLGRGQRGLFQRLTRTTLLKRLR